MPTLLRLGMCWDQRTPSFRFASSLNKKLMRWMYIYKDMWWVRWCNERVHTRFNVSENVGGWDLLANELLLPTKNLASFSTFITEHINQHMLHILLITWNECPQNSWAAPIFDVFLGSFRIFVYLSWFVHYHTLCGLKFTNLGCIFLHLVVRIFFFCYSKEDYYS